MKAATDDAQAQIANEDPDIDQAVVTTHIENLATQDGVKEKYDDLKTDAAEHFKSCCQTFFYSATQPYAAAKAIKSGKKLVLIN